MNVHQQPRTSIWPHPERFERVQIIDQRRLPHEWVIADLATAEETAAAIRDMAVRGAPLIGVTAAWGLFLASLQARESGRGLPHLRELAALLREARPTAVNLAWAVDRGMSLISPGDAPDKLISTLREFAETLTREDIATCEAIGRHGMPLIEKISQAKNGQPVNIMTHCNAGWLACVDYGTATAPIYLAHRAGIPLHVWVSETRPRLQGALTAWELGQEGIAHSIIPDNAAGHLMQHGMVDLVITGSDRTTARGDVANKIGTYLKAVAAKENGIPFYVALPKSTFDLSLSDGVKEIPIEQRSGTEITHVTGKTATSLETIQLFAGGSPAVNYGFDVTPARLVTGLITESGVIPAEESAIRSIF